MAKEETKKEAETVAPVAPVADARLARWKAHVANYAKANPIKHAAKEKRGEFNTIPDSFK